jgi:hypothetical protein
MLLVSYLYSHKFCKISKMGGNIAARQVAELAGGVDPISWILASMC